MIEAKFMCMNFIRAQLHGVIIQIRSKHFSVAMVSNQQRHYKGPECEDNFHFRHSGIQTTILKKLRHFTKLFTLIKSTTLKFQTHNTTQQLNDVS